jgi:hypothetical protein
VEPSIRVLPTVTIHIEIPGDTRLTASRGGSLSMPLREALQLADRLDGSAKGEFKLGIGDTEFTVTFDQPGEREQFVAALRAAATRQA